MDTNHYPAAQRLDIIDRLHGRDVADPYRWLEDPTDQRTAEWSAAQDRLCREHLDSLPGRDELAERVRELVSIGAVTAPVWRAGRAFFTRRTPGQEHPVLMVRDAGGERALVDPSAIDPTGKTTLDAWQPSIEGGRLAYQLSVGGDEESQLRVLDVDTGEPVDGPIDRCRYSSIAWLPGGDELYYVRRLPPSEVPDGEEQFHRRVWRHRVGADPATDVLVEGPGLYDDLTFYFTVHTSRDGRWLVVSGSPGTAPRDSVWIADRHATGELRAIVDQDDAVRCTAWIERDGRLYLLTTKGAPRWRLCVADPAEPGPEHWQELIAEDPRSVLDGVRWLDTDTAEPMLVLARTRHAVAEVHLHDPASGEQRGTIPMPGTGSLTGLSTVDSLTTDGRGSVWIGYSDFTTPPGVHRFDLSTKDTTEVEAAPGAGDLPAVHTQQVSYRSADGTEVRMFVVAGRARPDRPRPTLLTGYGGFSITNVPFFSALALTWAGAGGVWALASLRGGGEEGEDWHRAGMRGNKQNVFDDFHAAAAYLVEAGWTTPDQQAILGGSNGGLLVGAALTQRPAAYRAVVCSAPLLDMVRYERFSLGRTWNDEYGTADDPTEFGWLLSYSPYHGVRDSEAYPAVLFTVFESDTRVDPCHARKMCAALQHASRAGRPVLLRRETDVGHGARAVSRTVDLLVDEVAFLAAHTGLELRGLVTIREGNP